MADSHCENKNNEEVIFLLLFSADNWSPALPKVSENWLGLSIFNN